MNSFSSGCKQLSRSIDKFYVEFQLVHKRHSGNFHQLLKTEKIEFCEVLKGNSQLLSFAKDFIFPQGIKYKCPFKGSDFQINNLTYAPRPNSLLPLGVFRFVSSFKDDLDENIFSVTGALESRNVN